MTPEPQPSFGGELRRLRLSVGLSQEELAERAGLTAAAIGSLERGERRHPYPHTLQALADALGLPPADRARFFLTVPKRGSIDRSRDDGATPESGRGTAPPSPLTSLIGREEDVAMVTGLLERGNARLVTLTGTGGVGKTRLAIEVAGLLRGRFELGPAWIDLTPIQESGFVLPTIAQRLGLAERPHQSAAEMLATYLGRRKSLLVLDNFEHLLAATTSVSALLECCPRLSILVTSRETLRLRGEHEVQILPLGLPDPEAIASAQSVMSATAVELFLQRVRAVRPGYELTDVDAPLIAKICTRLDGIPLALELTAVQLKYMSPAALLERLQDRLASLEGGPRDLPPRQQSLRATITWSYGLLTTSERDLFRDLAVFAGGFTLEAIQSVCCTRRSQLGEIAPALAALVDKSLVQALPDANGRVRYAMLETIREYAKERLAESGEEGRLASQHAGYFADLAEAAAPHLTSASRSIWIQQLDVEVANLRAALAWSTTRGAPRDALRLVAALNWFWILRGYIREGAGWTDRVLARSVGSDAAAARAGALQTAAGLAWKREDYPTARRYADESLAMRRALGDPRPLAFSLSTAGLIATSQGDLERAGQFHRECLSLFREQDDRWGMAYALSNLGDVFAHMGDPVGARRNYAESLDEFERLGDPWGRGIVHHTLGNIAWNQGDAVSARAHYEASVTLLRSTGNRENIARGLIGLAAATLIGGEIDQAQELLIESLTIWQDFGSRAGSAACLDGLASIRAAQGGYHEAARLFGAAEVQARGRPSLYVVDVGMFSRYLHETRLHLGETAFAQAWAEGQAMTLEQAIAHALRGNGGTQVIA